jgi:hypothetical protein
MARWTVVAVAAAALACGAKDGGGGEPPPTACAAQDCLTKGATCGTIDDGCGNTLQCGTCGAGETCGANGKANVCGQGKCDPTTCEARGAGCGTIGDLCGGTLDCGGCPAGQTCGGGGTANVCGAPACQKTTCAAKGATCGKIADGCGGELACGDCKEGDACGAGGQPNVCAPIPPAGNVRWSQVVSTPGMDAPVGAGQDDRGNRYLLTFTPNEVGATQTLRFQRLDAAGAVAVTKEWAAVGFDPWGRGYFMSVTPDGSVYVAVAFDCGSNATCARSIDLGGGEAKDSVLVKLSSDGAFQWQRVFAGANLAALAANAQGTVAVSRWPRVGGVWAIDVFGADGKLARTSSDYAPAIALDPDGNLVTAGWGTVRKSAPDGSFFWQKALSGGGFPRGIQTTAKGTIVVLNDRSGDVEFGPSTVRSGALVLYVLEADARPRFARGLPWSGQPWLAVDPTGRAAVVGSGQCGEIVAEAFDLSNADLWRRFLPDGARCWAGMSTGPASYGSDHRLFVTGAFSMEIAVGGKTWTPRGQDALAVLLDP